MFFITGDLVVSFGGPRGSENCPRCVRGALGRRGGDGFTSPGALGDARGAFGGPSGGGELMDSLVQGLSAKDT